MMKKINDEILNAIGVTALKAHLKNIEMMTESMRSNMTDQEVRAAGWSAAIVNRQIKIEESLRDIDLRLGRLASQLGAEMNRDNKRLQDLGLEVERLSQSLEQVRAKN